MDEHGFREQVKRYIQLHDEIAEGQKMLGQLRKRRLELEAGILAYMKDNEIDQCNLADGKLLRRVSKTVQSLKRDYIVDELAKVFGGDGRRAEEIVGVLFSNRGVSEREVLKRTRARGGGGGGDGPGSAAAATE